MLRRVAELLEPPIMKEFQQLLSIFHKVQGRSERAISEWCFGPYGSVFLAEARSANVAILAPFQSGLSAEFSVVEFGLLVLCFLCLYGEGIS